MMPRLIGLMGYAGAGKSEVARHLCVAHGFDAPHIKAPFAAMFATLLREIGYGEEMIARIIDGDLKRAIVPELGVTSTQVQQDLGTAFGRNCIRPTIWLDLWCAKVDRLRAAGIPVVLESCRFPVEVDAIKARGGALVEIRRPGVGPANRHESERVPALADFVLHNDGTMDDLRARADRLVRPG